MHVSKTTEIIVGLFVAIGFAAIFFLSMQASNLSTIGSQEGYQISARFENIGGLKVRSPVTMAGVKLGRVSGIEFDPESFEAIVYMDISPKYKMLPSDSSASILTSGILGEQYVGLEAGGEEESLEQGSAIEITQSALVLEKLIGQFLFSKDSAN